MKTFNDIPEIKDRTYLKAPLAYACLTNMPITPGHTLIIPRRAVDKFEQLTNDEVLAVHQLAARAVSVLSEKIGAEGFNFAWNQGANYGQSVPHFHLHIVPRTPNDSGIINYEPRQFLYRPGSREVSPEDELRALAKLLAV